MTPESWDHLALLFEQAAAIPPAELPAWLDRVCAGDSGLKQQLSSFVDSRARGPSFLDQPAPSLESFGPLFQPGEQIASRFEIIALAGMGGMGEVYKARDLRLDRTVALKILPSATGEAKQRFAREAQAIAALNHPNVCTLFDAGDHAGVDYLVTEYIDGQTLSARLRQGPLSISEALDYALAILAALEAAHGAGIVHRDLKPSNIMLTPAGPKLLDFGLAKRGPSSLNGDPLSGASGNLAGTLLYMAPEQWAAQDSDHRADIWAFGCVLFEMLTGAPPSQAPPPLPPELVPTGLWHVIARCLEPDRSLRWQTVTDLRAELHWNTAPPLPAAPRPSHRTFWIIAAIAVALAVLGVIALGNRPRPEPITRLDIVTPPAADPFSFALSPDGRQLVFAADHNGPELWLRSLNQPSAKPIPGTLGASAPFWSPDAKSIGFFAAGKLKRIDLEGGQPQILAPAAEARGGAWTRDGYIVFSPSTAGPLLRVPAAGGPTEQFTRLEQTRHVSHRWPQVLPDGRVLFLAIGFDTQRHSGLYVAGRPGQPAKLLAATQSSGAYVEPGHLLMANDGGLIARPFNLASGALGDAVQVAHPVGSDATIWRTAFSVAGPGVLAHRGITAARRQLVWVDRRGSQISVVGDTTEQNQLTPSLSPDGRRIAVQRTAQQVTQIWILGAGREIPVRLRDALSPAGRPVWSPDGRRIAFLTAVDRAQALLSIPADGTSAQEQILVRGMPGVSPLDWSTDARYLIFSASSEITGWDIWALPLSGNPAKPIPVLQTAANEEFAQLSPDGRWIAYQSDETGRAEIYIQPFLSPGERLPVSQAGGITPRWRRDSRELFYIAPDGSLMAVPLRMLPGSSTIMPNSPIRLFHPDIAGSGANPIGGAHQFCVSPDGQSFLINKSLADPATPISIVLNWQTALRP